MAPKGNGDPPEQFDRFSPIPIPPHRIDRLRPGSGNRRRDRQHPGEHLQRVPKKPRPRRQLCDSGLRRGNTRAQAGAPEHPRKPYVSGTHRYRSGNTRRWHRRLRRTVDPPTDDASPTGFSSWLKGAAEGCLLIANLLTRWVEAGKRGHGTISEFALSSLLQLMNYFGLFT